MITTNIFESSPVQAGADVLRQLQTAIDGGHDIDLKVGVEMMPLKYPEARFLRGIYKAYAKQGRQEEGLNLLGNASWIMSALDKLDAKLASYKTMGSVPGDRGVDEGVGDVMLEKEVSEVRSTRNPAHMSPSEYEQYQQNQMDWEKRDFKRREMEHELAGEEEAYRREMSGNWYIRINGKILKDKQGNPFTFRGKAAANKAALTMMAKPFNAGKKFTLTTSWSDAPPPSDVSEDKPGLWANIHAKRERIKHGSNERMREPGSKGAPTASAFKAAAKTSKKKVSEFAVGDGGEDPIDNYPCYDCGSTIFLHHTKLCELAEDNAIRDLPSKNPKTQHWNGVVPKGLHPIPGLNEGSVTKKPQPYNEPGWAKKLPKEKLDALAGTRYPKKDKKQKGVAEGAEFGSNYAEQLAQKVFDHNSNIKDENQVLNLGYNIAKNDLGSRAQGIFRDEDFPSDFVSAYGWLQDQKQGVAEAGPFSYGAKKPRKGSVAYNDLMKRKEQDRKRVKDIEAIGTKNHHVGVAKVTKDVAEDSLEEIDRRGFLRGMGAAALGAAGIKAQAGQTQDIGDGFELATINVAGHTVKAVLDTQTNIYYTLNRAENGSAILRSPAPFIMVRDGQVKMAMNVGPATAAAIKKAGLEKMQEGVAEDSQRVDSLVTDALKLMRGPEASDAVSALKTVLGNREYNSRRGHYSFYVRQMLDMYNKQGVAEGEDIDTRIANLKDAIRFETPRSIPGERPEDQYIRHAEKIAGYKAELKKLVAQKKQQGVAEGIESQYMAARYIDEFGDGDHWYVKGTPDVIKKFVLLANSLEDEAVKGTEYEPGKGMMGGVHAELGNDAAPQWTVVPARNLEAIKPIGDKVLQRLMRPNLADGAQEFMSELLWAMEAKGLALVTDDSQQGVAEGNDDDIWGPQGNFAGDTKVELGNVSMKNIQVGDVVTYFGEKAKVLELGPTQARISANGKTLNVRKSDLKQLGRGVAEGSLNEFAPDAGDGGEEETLHKYARMWYNGDLGTQHQIEKILDRMGWEIGEIESEEGGAFVVQAGDENGNSYIGFAPADLTEGVTEAFDQPYKLKWYPGDWDEVTAYADIPDGDLTIIFNNDQNEEGEEAWSVEFYRNGSQEITGEGDKFRIFATVLDAIKKFIRHPKYKPNRIIFSASKEVEPGQKIQSRANLYDTLVQRYARGLGFKAFKADAGNKVHYELSKINKGVAEGLNEMDKSAPQPGRDGRVSHSTYGSRDKKGSDYFKGKEAPGKAITAKQMAKDALDILKKQGVAEGNSGAKYRVKSIGKDSRGDYYISPSTGKKVYKKARVGDHENPHTGEIKPKIAESDPSGLMHAAKHLNNEYIITAKTAEGNTKRYRVRAQSERTARERFAKHYSQAKIIKVENTSNINETQDDNPVMSSIIRRIMLSRPDLLKYGPGRVMDAVSSVAEFVGAVDEIGTSDVSAWVAQVERELKTHEG